MSPLSIHPQYICLPVSLQTCLISRQRDAKQNKNTVHTYDCFGCVCTRTDCTRAFFSFKTQRGLPHAECNFICRHQQSAVTKLTAARRHCVEILVYIVVLLWKKTFFSMVKVKVKFSLEQAMKAQRGSRGIALLFL